MGSPDRQKPTIRDLFPELTPKEAERAEANMTRYLDLLRRIAESAHHEHPPVGPTTPLDFEDDM